MCTCSIFEFSFKAHSATSKCACPLRDIKAPSSHPPSRQEQQTLTSHSNVTPAALSGDRCIRPNRLCSLGLAYFNASSLPGTNRRISVPHLQLYKRTEVGLHIHLRLPTVITHSTFWLNVQNFIPYFAGVLLQGKPASPRISHMKSIT